jgi:hypothetical protein
MNHGRRLTMLSIGRLDIDDAGKVGFRTWELV